MLTSAESIYNADMVERQIIAKQFISKSASHADTLRSYIMSVGDEILMQMFFGTKTTIEKPTREIILPANKKIYAGSNREDRNIIMRKLSKKELSFMIQSYLPIKDDRDYIVELIFYRDNFLKKNTIDLIDSLAESDKVFYKTLQTRKKVLKYIGKAPKDERDYGEDAANDRSFTPLIERIEDIEPGAHSYAHQVYLQRIEYVESLFCHTVMLLADLPENHVWALDPQNHAFYIPEKLGSKIQLIHSICNFYRIFDTTCPNLRPLIEGTVRSWIWIYKGFGVTAVQR